MNHKQFFAVFGLLSFLIIFLQVTAVRLNLYYELPWLDVLMHILGGVWLACIIFALYSFYISKRSTTLSRASFLSILFTLTFIGGICWELIELEKHVTDLGDISYWPDTISDLLFDLTGALLGALGLMNHYRIR